MSFKEKVVVAILLMAAKFLAPTEWRKEIGENLANDEGHADDEPDLYRIGKHEAGAFLDGVEHYAFPEVRA